MLTRTLLLLLTAALLLPGCGDDEESSTVPTVTVAAPPASGCTPATTDLMTPLANKLSIEKARLINGQIVKSADHDDVYFVSAELDSPQHATSGDVATWATTSPGGAEGIYSVNDLALAVSSWRAATAIDVKPTDAGAEESRACVFR